MVSSRVGTGRRVADAAADEGARAERRRLQVMLGVFCLATFLVNGSATSVAPFLLEMARDLQTDLAATGGLVSITSVSWGVASLAAGIASDRLGRKPLLVAGLLILAISPIGVALSESYGAAAAWRLLGGIGGGTFMGTVFATVADRFPSAERGRALGWIITGMSLSMVFGVPAVTFIGSFIGWRGALASQGFSILVAAAVVWFVTPRASKRSGDRPMPAGAMLKLLTPRIVALLAAGTMERVCYAGVVVYFATYLLTSYAVSLQELAIALALIAIGNLVGNFVGSYLTDRLPGRLLLAAASLVITGALALPMLLGQPGVAISIVLGFAYTFVNALGRPPLLASMSEVSNEARGALMGLNITFSSFGWLGAAGLGGWLIVAYGFPSLGILTAITGVAGGVLAALSWLLGRPK
jgi:DHA1 family inner membrane transport protein